MEPGFKESEKQQEAMAKVRQSYELSAQLLRAKDMLKQAQEKRRNAFDHKAAESWSQAVFKLEGEIEELELQIWCMRGKAA